jgi:hypothetical protein
MKIHTMLLQIALQIREGPKLLSNYFYISFFTLIVVFKYLCALQTTAKKCRSCFQFSKLLIFKITGFDGAFGVLYY